MNIGKERVHLIRLIKSPDWSIKGEGGVVSEVQTWNETGSKCREFKWLWRLFDCHVKIKKEEMFEIPFWAFWLFNIMYPFDTFWYNEADKKYVFVKSFWNSDKNFQNIREVKLNNKMFLKCTLTAHKNIVLTIIPTVLKKGYEDSIVMQC